jgi:hypothetical protein
MRHPKSARAVSAALAAATLAAVTAAPALGEKPGIEGSVGPSTGTPPYVLPVAPGVQTRSAYPTAWAHTATTATASRS